MSNKNAYRLINPYIEGSLETVVRARNSFSAGKKIYNNLSTHFTNHVKDFYMTIQNVETKDLTNFRIDEKRGKNNIVDFNLVKLDNSLPAEMENKLIGHIEKLEKQSGGKRRHHKKDDSTSDSCSSTLSESDYNYYKIPLQPITKFIYYWLPYYKLNLTNLSPIDINRLFLPMFSLPINPTLELRFDIYKYSAFP